MDHTNHVRLEAAELLQGREIVLLVFCRIEAVDVALHGRSKLAPTIGNAPQCSFLLLELFGCFFSRRIPVHERLNRRTAKPDDGNRCKRDRVQKGCKRSSNAAYRATRPSLPQDLVELRALLNCDKER